MQFYNKMRAVRETGSFYDFKREYRYREACRDTDQAPVFQYALLRDEEKYEKE